MSARLIPALFLGVATAAALIFPMRAPSWQMVIGALIAQAAITILWWRHTAARAGVIITVPLALWLITLSGANVLFVVLQGQTMRALLLLGLALTSALVYMLWFERYRFAAEYQKHHLEEWYKAVTLLTAFVWSAALFALFILLRLPAWFTSIFLAATESGLLLMTLYAPRAIHGLSHGAALNRTRAFWLITTSVLIIFEMVWTLHFLPLGFFVNAFIITGVYGALMTVGGAFLAERAFSRNEKVALGVIGALVALVIASARWI